MARSDPTKTRPTDPINLERFSKGKRPQYFDDPKLDKLWAVVLALAGELSVARDRIDGLELLLQRKSVVEAGELDDLELTDDEAAARKAARQRYLERVLRAVTLELESTD